MGRDWRGTRKAPLHVDHPPQRRLAHAEHGPHLLCVENARQLPFIAHRLGPRDTAPLLRAERCLSWRVSFAEGCLRNEERCIARALATQMAKEDYAAEHASWFSCEATLQIWGSQTATGCSAILRQHRHGSAS